MCMFYVYVIMFCEYIIVCMSVYVYCMYVCFACIHSLGLSLGEVYVLVEYGTILTNPV